MFKNYLYLLPSIFVLLLGEQIFCSDRSMEEMLFSLELADYWDRKTCERFPVTMNHLLSGGYFTTHSARMKEEGEIGFGLAQVPPYLNGNVSVQPFHHLELSANYRIFHGYQDPAIGSQGFGNYADRGANVKYAIILPEESWYRYPGLAVGIDDCIGTKKFTNYYIVATQVFKNIGLEVSLGWGRGTYSEGPSQGFFGGVNWFPWITDQNKWPRGFCLTAELDPTNYHKDPHPNRPISHTPFNVGIKYMFSNILELSASYIRGDAFAVAGSLHYNLGNTEGFLPKIQDPLPYSAPIDRQPLGCYRHADAMIQELYYSFKDQGFQLTEAWLETCDCTQNLWISLFNCCYRHERIAQMRIRFLLAALTPSNIDKIIVTVESYGLPCQSYVYKREWLIDYANQCMSPYEFDIISPRVEALEAPESAHLIFKRKSELWRCKISPRFETFLGNAKGKFKYDAGLKGSIDGFLPHNWYYEVQASFTFLSSINNVADFDFFHPSQLPNVATDYIRYRQEGSFTWDMLYAQKCRNWGHGFYTRAALGYFQVNYAGIAGEILWYPACTWIAVGAEGAVVKKRSFSGLGFQSRLRHFKGKVPVYEHYTTLQQGFLNLYFDFPTYHFFTKISVGQFLAHDKGVRLEGTRYFDNGLRLRGWITLTDAYDVIHGEKYYDKGIAIEIPFDFFYKRSSRRVWNYAMAAWLRDAGYTTRTGKPLFEIINRERLW